MSPSVIHIDTELTWRGGQRQVAFLAQGMQAAGANCHLAVVEGSELHRRLGTTFPCFVFQGSRLRHMLQTKALAHYCRTHGITIADAHSSHGHNIALRLRRHAPATKVIIHRRVDYAPGDHFWDRRKYLSPQIDRYVAISQAIAGILSNYGIAPNRIATVPSAVKSRHYTVEERTATKQRIFAELGLSSELPLIANVAYLTTQKGHETLLAALKLLTEQGIAWQAIIAGDGPLRTSLEHQAQQANLKNLHFLGVRDDVDALLLAADFFAMPSNFEGLGTSLLDAMTMGLPVVASRVGGIPEYVHHGETGLLQGVGDATGLANNLATLMQNPQDARQMAERGANLVKERYGVEAMVAGNMAVYRSVNVD